METSVKGMAARIKPLYAKIRRTGIGEFLATKDFHLLAVERDWDEDYERGRQEILRSLGHLSSGPDHSELAFGYLMQHRYSPSDERLGELVVDVLLAFDYWTPKRLDLKALVDEMKRLEFAPALLQKFEAGHLDATSSKRESAASVPPEGVSHPTPVSAANSSGAKKKKDKWMAKYVFLDVERFTREDRNADCQAAIIDGLYSIVEASLKQFGIEKDDPDRTLLLPTGDGVCICLLGDDGDYDEHIQIALSVLEKLKAHNEAQVNAALRFEVRIGVNAHIDLRVLDIRKQWNMAGRGISEAQRIMSAGDGGNVIVSEGVYKNLIDFNEYLEPHIQFRPSIARDKHGNERPIYQYTDSNASGLNNSAPKPKYDAGEAKLRAGESQFWLGHDLRLLWAQLGQGASKERVLKGLRQILLHYASSGMSVDGIQERLVAMLREIESLPDPHWQADVWRQHIVTVDSIIDDLGRWMRRSAMAPLPDSAERQRQSEPARPQEAQGWQRFSDSTLPSDILSESRGALTVWAKVTDDHNRIQAKAHHQYIVAHASNRGLDLGNPDYAKYPNAWAIRRTSPSPQARSGLWSFWCNGMERIHLEMNSPSKLSPGWHMFTVEWSSEKNFIHFFIDGELAAQDEYKLWPKGLTGSMVLGTWVNDNVTHRFNSDVGPCFTIPRTLEDGELLTMLKTQPAG